MKHWSTPEPVALLALHVYLCVCVCVQSGELIEKMTIIASNSNFQVSKENKNAERKKEKNGCASQWNSVNELNFSANEFEMRLTPLFRVMVNWSRKLRRENDIYRKLPFVNVFEKFEWCGVCMCIVYVI